MQDFAGKVAFITGGGSGVGLGQAKVFARAGARVVIADISADHLDHALNYFRHIGTPVHGIHLDVTDRAAFERAAQETERLVGPVQLLFNTAGVSMFGPLEKSTYEDYDWMMGVNFGGVVNGIQTFVPRMIERGQGGYIVNTASMSGLIASGPAGIYCASKFAVVGLSQALRQSLDRYDIGVSVLCPGNVNTNIAECTRNRPPHLANTGYHIDADVVDAFRTIYSAGMDPVHLAEHLIEAMRRNQLYVIPYAEFSGPMQERLNLALKVIPDPKDDPGMAGREAAMTKRRAERAAESQKKAN